jgi:DNA-binding protein Fis
MGCGCKNKNNGSQAQQAQTAQPNQTQQQVKNPTIQESIKKVVEKYYNKK